MTRRVRFTPFLRAGCFVAALAGIARPAAADQVAYGFSLSVLTLPGATVGAVRLWACAVERADRGLLAAFTTQDRWRQLLYSARGLHSGQPHAVELGSALLHHAMTTWNRSFTSPPAPVREELGSVLPRVLSRLDVDTAALLRHSLRPFLPNI